MHALQLGKFWSRLVTQVACDYTDKGTELTSESRMGDTQTWTFSPVSPALWTDSLPLSHQGSS